MTSAPTEGTYQTHAALNAAVSSFPIYDNGPLSCVDQEVFHLPANLACASSALMSPFPTIQNDHTFLSADLSSMPDPPSTAELPVPPMALGSIATPQQIVHGAFAEAPHSILEPISGQTVERWVESKQVGARDRISVQFTRSTRELQVTCIRTLIDIGELDPTLDASGEHQQAIEGLDLLKMWLCHSSARVAESGYTSVATGLIQGTLNTVASMFDTYNKSKYKMDTSNEVETNFSLDLVGKMHQSTPIDQSTSLSAGELPRCYRLAKTTFTSLEHALRWLGEPIEGLVPQLQECKGCQVAVKSVVSALHGQKFSEATGIGTWAWEKLVSPMKVTAEASTTAPLMERGGYPSASESARKPLSAGPSVSTVLGGDKFDANVINMDGDKGEEDAIKQATASRKSCRKKQGKPVYDSKIHPSLDLISEHDGAVTLSTSSRKRKQHNVDACDENDNLISIEREGRVAEQDHHA